MSASTPPASGDGLLRLIAAFKLAKGLLLLALALGAFHLMHSDVADTLTAWAGELRLDPDGRLLQAGLRRAIDLDPHRLVALGVGLLFYAALLFTEGTGLMLRKRWAEYFTVAVTMSFVPLEVYEIVRRVTATRIALLAVNVAIVWYLIVRVRRTRDNDDHAASGANGRTR